MCKFKDAQDPNYQKVVEFLERWAKELKEDTKKVDIKEGKIQDVTPTSSPQEAMTEPGCRQAKLSRIPRSGITTKGVSSGCLSRKAQSTLVVAGPG